MLSREAELIALIGRATAAVARAAEVTERTRRAADRARDLVRDVALQPSSDPAWNHDLTGSLRAFSELERADHSLARLREDISTARELLGAASGKRSAPAPRIPFTVAGVPAGADLGDPLRAVARVIALAETTWHLVHQTAELVEDATGSAPPANLARRLHANAALSVVRLAARRADALTAGATTAGRHLALASGRPGEMTALLSEARAAAAAI